MNKQRQDGHYWNNASLRIQKNKNLYLVEYKCHRQP